MPWRRRRMSCSWRPSSGPFVGIVIELTDDRGHAGLARNEMISAIAIAAEAAALAQRIERARDLASVVAAERLDDIGIEHRSGCERLLDRLEARRAGKDLGGASRVGDLAGAAETPGAVEARLGAGLATVERGIHGLALHPLQDDQVLIGLEAGAERPFCLAVVVDVDVVVEDVDRLQPHDAFEDRLDGGARLARRALPDRNPQGAAAARRRTQIDRDRLSDSRAHGLNPPSTACAPPYSC